MFNKKQRLGVFILMLVIIILQAFIVFYERIYPSSEIAVQDSLTLILNSRTEALQLPLPKEKKYFRFDPNKLEYSYWEYFSLSDEQLYKLDSFRANNFFDSYKQLREVLHFNAFQDSIFSQYVYFEKASKRKFEWKSKETGLFRFNPNAIGQDDWQRLGFSEKQSEVIVSYIKKYGPIHVKEDLEKIYIIDSTKLKTLWTYIDLPDLPKTADFEKDLNKCKEGDLELLCAVPSDLAMKIVDYRNRLGGYCSVYQLKEVKGLGSGLFDTLKSVFYIEKDFVARKLNINKASIEELEAHPYLRKSLANKIYSFRKNFRDFESVEELKNIESLSDAYFDKIALYLSAD